MNTDTNTTNDIAVEPAPAEATAPSEAAPLARSGLEGTELSPEEIDALKAKADLAAQHWDRLLRVSADFDNFKKRAGRERQDAIKFANESLLQKLIPVLDNFDMARAAIGTSQNPAAQSLEAGISMIHQQLKNVLMEAGLEEIEATGKAFDPNLHEAVAQEDADEAPEGQVLRQVRKGYRLRERLLRPASVVVARKPSGKHA